MLLGWPKRLWACDVMHRATTHLAKQFTVEMSHDEAQANADARVILLCASRRVIEDAAHEPAEVRA